MNKLVKESIEFNFKRPPLDRFKPKSPVYQYKPNPRKERGRYSDEEEDIIERHEIKIKELEKEISQFDSEIEDLKYELKNIDSNNFDDAELESFYSEVQEIYGDKILDILNSGLSEEEKLERMKAAQSLRNDKGVDPGEQLLSNYNYYHPQEPSEEEIDKINQRIKKIEVQKKERENSINKLETKIYNLRTY